MKPNYRKLLLSLFFATVFITVNAQTFKQINIEIEADSISELEAHPYTNDDVIGNFIVDGLRFDTVDIHYRGAYYLFQLMKKGALRNWKIKTSKYQKFENRREWNFNYENYIRQNLAYHVFREAGVPCVSSENVILSVNGRRKGLYLKYEDPDNKDWLGETFGDDEGDLYKAAFDMPSQEKFFADLTYLGDNDEDYFLHYRKQTNKKGAKEFDYSSIRAFISLINHTPDEEFEATIAENFDVDEFIRYLVISNFIANWDSYPFRPKNYFLYNNPDDKKWHFIPWDLDGTFQEIGGRNPIKTTGSVFHYFDGIDPYNSTPTEPLDRPLVWRMMEVERFRNQYIYEYQQATETFLSVSYLNEVIDSIQSGVEQNTSGTELSDFKSDVSITRNFITKRHAIVVNELDDFEVEKPVAINELFIKKQTKLRLFPNPAKNYVNILLPVCNQGKVQIHIKNLTGQSVFSSTKICDASDKIFRMDLINIPVGSYIVNVKSDCAVYSAKLIVIN